MSGIAVPGAGAGGPLLDRLGVALRPHTRRVADLARRAGPLVPGLSWAALAAAAVALAALPAARAVAVQAAWSGWLLVQVLLLLPTRSLSWRAGLWAAAAGALTAVAAAVLPLDRLVGRAVEDQLLVVLPLVAFLRGTARARSAGLADVVLVGTAAGAGYQAVQAAAARAAGTDPGGWALLTLLPGGASEGGRAWAGLALSAGLVAAAAAVGRRFGTPAWPGHLPRPVTVLVLGLVTVDRLVWEAREALPAWLLRIHDVLGGGGLAGPLLLGLLVGAVLVDHRDLVRRRDRLPRIPGERGDPADVARTVVAAAPGGTAALAELGDLLRRRRRLGYATTPTGPGHDPAADDLPEAIEASRQRLAAILTRAGWTGIPVWTPLALARWAAAAVVDGVLRRLPPTAGTRVLASGSAPGWVVDARHLFHGTLGRGGRVSGFHHRGSVGADARARVVPGTCSPPDGRGVYTGVVELAAGAGWRRAPSATGFFPDAWPRARVLDEIHDALAGAHVEGARWHGTTPSGVPVTGTVDRRGAVRAEPVYDPAS